MNRVFIGADSRNTVAASVLTHSIHQHSSSPVMVTQIRIDQLPVSKKGLTEFTFTRYLVPWMCHYSGAALFLDADMLLTADINELFALNDGEHPVYVVQGRERFEWPSLMLFNNELCRQLTPEYITESNPSKFEWASSVGRLPAEWNHCVGYDEPKPAKLIHYTAGVPIFKEVWGLGCEHDWIQAYEQMRSTVSWIELMGRSVHTEKVFDKIKARVAKFNE